MRQELLFLPRKENQELGRLKSLPKVTSNLDKSQSQSGSQGKQGPKGGHVSKPSEQSSILGGTTFLPKAHWRDLSN